jgi:dihydrofolate synthase/folylpolyglutamate synthase
LARRLYAVPVPDADRSLAPGLIAETSNRLGIPAESASNVETALAAAKALSLESPPRILIGGSLYLAGDVLRRNGTPPE